MSTHELRSIRVVLEIPCNECEGRGTHQAPDSTSFVTKTMICSDCDGTGYTQNKIPLLCLKNLLEGGSL